VNFPDRGDPRLATGWCRPVVAITAIVAGTIVASGCGDDDANVAYVPTYQERACWESVLADDPTALCGVVTVPENRADPSGRQVEIAVARLHARAPSGRPPLLFLEGGPSVSTLQIRAGHFNDVLRDAQDLIIFDQRGVGYSNPALDCPEREEALWQSFNQTGDPEAELETINGASLACVDRLRAEGVDLTSYDTVESAADVADIRTALAIEEWDVYGASYGTTLALELMRSHPEGIRSVVLDAVSPPQRGLTVDRVATTGERALDAMEDACKRSALCTAATGGSFRELLEEVRDALDAAPMRLEVADGKNGGTRPVTIDGSDIVAGVFNSLYETPLLSQIPTLLALIRTRNQLVVQEAARAGINNRIIFYEGMFLAVDCRDRGRYWAGDDLRAFLESRRDLISLYNFFAIPACADLDLGYVDESFNRPVVSDIPTLIFGGQYDPVTPPAWGAETGETLSRSTFFLFPGIGHGALNAHPCPAEIARQFLADPTTPPAGECIDEMPDLPELFG
jgi:pimeloyl-ACP methyl ester carboxylesterase